MKILFVCLGNICRSPAAEGIFRSRLQLSDINTGSIIVDSAGTGDWHIGHAPDKRMQKAAAVRSYDLSQLKARQVKPEDFMAFDLILGMDRSNLNILNSIRSSLPGATAHTDLFLPYAGITETEEVPDPYYGTEKDFNHTLDLIEQGSDALIRRIKENS